MGMKYVLQIKQNQLPETTICRRKPETQKQKQKTKIFIQHTYKIDMCP
jgi:hypothetical protein